MQSEQRLHYEITELQKQWELVSQSSYEILVVMKSL